MGRGKGAQLHRPGSSPFGADTGLIDCDLHAEVPSIETLFPYLPDYWIEHVTNTNFEGPVDAYYPPAIADRNADRARPADVRRMQADVLDATRVQHGILHCTYAVDGLHNPDQAIAVARATNDWLRAEWLAADPRLRAAIVVPPQFPDLARDEVERVAEHRGFVEVLLPAHSAHPYGNRVYRPIWEAATRHDLVVCLHFGGAPGNPPTPSGWPTYYLEHYAAMAQVFATQVASLVVEGVFDLYPTLRVTLAESGLTWLPVHMWHVDKEWKNLRRLVPWVKRPPSDYLREHVRLTLQPVDAPDAGTELLEVIDQLQSDDMLLYSSDYPHRDVAGESVAALWNDERRTARILHDNAAAWYRF